MFRLLGLLWEAILQSHRGRWLEEVEQLKAMGLRFEPPTRVTGRLDGCPVEIEADAMGAPSRAAVVGAPMGASFELRTASILSGTLSDAVRPGARLYTGDKAFDAVVGVYGEDEAEAVAALDDLTRRAVMRAVRHGAMFRDGRWRWAWGDEAPADGLAQRLREVVAAARVLSVPRDLAAQRRALLDRARSDRVMAVRERALEHWLASGEPEVDALRSFEGGYQASLSVRAALARGAAGAPTLRRWLSEGSRTWRLRAAVGLAALGDYDPAVESVLVAALGDEALRDDAAGALAPHAGPSVLPMLLAANTAAASRAAASVRARLDPRVVGGLSLAEAGGGALAEAEVSGSGLSAPAPQEGPGH